jgi:hypothetical protein
MLQPIVDLEFGEGKSMPASASMSASVRSVAAVPADFPAWVFEHCLVRVPAGTCIMRGVALQARTNASPYPGEETHLFLCSDDEEAQEYAKEAPHFCYRYSLTRDLLVFDQRVLAEAPASLPAEERDRWHAIVQLFLGSEEGSADGGDRALRRSEEPAKSRQPGRSREGRESRPHKECKSSERHDGGQADSAAARVKLRRYFDRLCHPSVESPSTDLDAAVLEVLRAHPIPTAAVRKAQTLDGHAAECRADCPVSCPGSADGGAAPHAKRARKTVEPGSEPESTHAEQPLHWDGVVRRSRSEYLGRVVQEFLVMRDCFRVNAHKAGVVETLLAAAGCTPVKTSGKAGVYDCKSPRPAGEETVAGASASEEAAESAPATSSGAETKPSACAGAASGGAGDGGATTPCEPNGSEDQASLHRAFRGPGDCIKCPVTPRRAISARGEAATLNDKSGGADDAASAGKAGGTTLERGALSLVEILKVPPERQKVDRRRRTLELPHSAAADDDAACKQHLSAMRRAEAACGATSSHSPDALDGFADVAAIPVACASPPANIYVGRE